MEILHTIGCLSAELGGLSVCTYNLLSAMNRRQANDSVNVSVFTPQPRLAGEYLLGNEEWISSVENDCISHYEYSSNIRKWLKNSKYDLYHTNGVWLYINHITCKAARSKNIPYIISTHGMLYSEALQRSYWKKLPFRLLFFDRDVANATCIHATCKKEMEEVRNFGYKGPIAVIPNPTYHPSYLDEVYAERLAFIENSYPKRFGYLGRLHPIKKVENIIYALAEVSKTKSCELVIMGKGDDGYENFLKSEVKRLGLQNVFFCGFVSGREKYEHLSKLSCLFVPSDFENFGMVVTEALSVGVPVMASLGTPWKELNTEKCGWWSDSHVENIEDVMMHALETPVNTLKQMGERGRRLVVEKYSAEKIADDMAELYKWIIKGGEKPEFVYEMR